ncbi:hypothetical protein N7532_006172 [Penicillium argentinense]|uniref:Glycosyl transferase CAP10 domain-containing protein n=1 Tax=Penicillium argentinense TaxID=1131581 RepID=A0A9W9FFF7_9EURO|nr:uncharacterized protein N7532_006172 [Penicillium argentinense]KAJ5099171.1 hypothetical protein N7532_006172 [Penicillium argentinense]
MNPVNSDLNLYRSSKPNHNDFSPDAIRWRIRAAHEHANVAFTTQSTNPQEAISEYKRRYRRDPPSGFSNWVQFALDHGSKVIDDFDEIHRDLEPFRTPEAQRWFHQLNNRKEDWANTRRVIIENGAINASSSDGFWNRLVTPFLHALPNNSVFYINTLDEPRVLSRPGPPPDQIKFAESAGQSIEDLVKASCSQIPRELTGHLDPEKDVCQFSTPGKLHSMIASPSSFSYTYSLLPILSYARMSAFRDILIPCPDYVRQPVLDSDNLIPFLEKKAGVYWRGRSTGGRVQRLYWKDGHRQRFVSFTQSLQNAAKSIDTSRYFGAKIGNLDQKKISLFKDVFDVQMADYIQCEDKSACDDMQRVLGHEYGEPGESSLNYRYLFDLDGNSMTSRFYRLLSQQAVVLKQTLFQEWHDDRLIPWAHYIPVTMSMDELPELLNFLINDPEGEQLSLKIAQTASTWSRQALREIDMSIYLYRLLLELAEIFGPVDPLQPGYRAVMEPHT